MEKKKQHFWQLSVIFAAITTLSLMYNWGYAKNSEASMAMMGQSMASMMSSMHLTNINLSSLFAQEEQKEAMTGIQTHHERPMDFTKMSHYITTGVIIVLLPFIIAGAVFLAIVWFK